jgi:hypothetical protein
VYINNVKQEEGSGKSYTASGTTITFSAAVASTDSCYVVFLGSAVQTVNPPDNSVGITQLAVSDGSNGQLLSTNGSGTLSFTTVSTALDDISTGDAASTLATSSGDITIDSPADINLDAAGQQIFFKKAGTTFGQVQTESTPANLTFECPITDGDIIFKGDDGGSGIEAMRIDMSRGGHLVINDTDSNGFGLKVKNQLSTFETTGNDTFGQVFIHATGTNNDAQIAFSSDSNGRGIYVDESDSNTFRIYSGAGKGHSSLFLRVLVHLKYAIH